MKNSCKFYTADDEEPMCIRCDHILDPIEYCIDSCGPDHAWSRYIRTSDEKETKD